MQNTKIEWAHHTFNPWMGCTKVSPACKNCYAERDMDHRFGRVKWGPSGTRTKTEPTNWRVPLKWDRKAADLGIRYRVFCASLADVFEDWRGAIHDHRSLVGCVTSDGDRGWVPPHKDGTLGKVSNARPLTMDDLRRDLFDLIDATPNLDWLLLTKRPENILRMWPMTPGIPAPFVDGYERPTQLMLRPNVWLGTSVENQEQADKRIPELLKCRDLSPVLFLSMEPMLEAVDVGLSIANCDCCGRWASRWIELPRAVRGDWPVGHDTEASAGIYRAESNRHGALSVKATNEKMLGIKPDEMNVLGPIDWIIAGGESGPDARPSHPDWFRSLRDQCVAAGVPFFFKQWGEWGPWDHRRGTTEVPGVQSVPYRPGCPDPYPLGWVRRVGKKAAGRLLDGREWNELPQVIGS